MPRQPYLSIVPLSKGTAIDVGSKSIGQRPELETIIGNCLLVWPHVEAEMALLLGQLLGAENAAALAVFRAIRHSRTQREAISEAAAVAVSAVDQELITAILNVHKSIELERNALTHGHFGTSSKITDGILWMNTNDYVAIRARITIAKDSALDDARYSDLLSRIWVYRSSDLKTIFEDMKELADIWYNLIVFLQTDSGSQLRADRYRVLCDRPHVAQELVKLRREKTPPTPAE